MPSLPRPTNKNRTKKNKNYHNKTLANIAAGRGYVPGQPDPNVLPWAGLTFKPAVLRRLMPASPVDLPLAAPLGLVPKAARAQSRSPVRPVAPPPSPKRGTSVSRRRSKSASATRHRRGRNRVVP